MFVLGRHLQLRCSRSLHSLLWRVPQVDVLNLWEVELLGTEHGARSGDSDPADKRLRRNLVVLHGIEADEGACASKASLAVDSNRTSIRVREVLLAAGHELVNDCLRWGRAIREDHILVVDSLRQERVAVILGLVQTDHLRHIQVLEYVDIACGGVAVPVDGVPLVDRPHESQKLAWDNPVQVAILNLLVVLVLTRVERLEVVPSQRDGLL